MGDLILADFQSKTYHKPQTQVEDNLTDVAAGESGNCPKPPYVGAGIDGMELGKDQ